MTFAEMTTKELKDMAEDLHHACYVVECYGTKDLINLMGALRELDNRGVKYDDRRTLEFFDDEEDDDE